MIVTASHNPPSFNGFKLLGPQAVPLRSDDIATVARGGTGSRVDCLASLVVSGATSTSPLTIWRCSDSRFSNASQAYASPSTPATAS